VHRDSLRLPETIAFYRHTFGHDEAAKLTLCWLLERCGMLKRIDTDEQRILHNWGVELLDNMGLIADPNYRRLVDAVLQFGVPQEAIDTQGEKNG